MDTENFVDFMDSDDNSWLYEYHYFDVVDRMADLIVSYGRDKVMADVTEKVLEKLQELDRA
jgi:hypothetical protein